MNRCLRSRVIGTAADCRSPPVAELLGPATDDRRLRCIVIAVGRRRPRVWSGGIVETSPGPEPDWSKLAAAKHGMPPTLEEWRGGSVPAPIQERVIERQQQEHRRAQSAYDRQMEKEELVTSRKGTLGGPTLEELEAQSTMPVRLVGDEDLAAFADVVVERLLAALSDTEGTGETDHADAEDIRAFADLVAKRVLVLTRPSLRNIEARLKALEATTAPQTRRRVK